MAHVGFLPKSGGAPPPPVVEDQNHVMNLPNVWGDTGRLKFHRLKGTSRAATSGMEKSVSLPSLDGKFRPPEKSLGCPKHGFKDKIDWSDESGQYLGGKVRNLRVGTVLRLKESISHDLSWLWYRMRRDPNHPLRKLSMQLPSTNVTSGLRDSGSFEFWRDLRPPMIVTDLKRLNTWTRDGSCTIPCDAFEVHYECALEFKTERAWGGNQDGGTFDNVIHAVAKVQLPTSYPSAPGSELIVVDWGTPALNWAPSQDGEDAAAGDAVDWASFQSVMDNNVEAQNKRGRRGNEKRSSGSSVRRKNMSGGRKSFVGKLSSNADSEDGSGATIYMSGKYDDDDGQEVLTKAPGDDHGFKRYTKRRQTLLAHCERQKKDWRPENYDTGNVRQNRVVCSAAGHIWYNG